jgi:hypothetical protein
LAAEADEERAKRAARVRELTFSTDDGSLFVRIFPNDGGGGATAVLVGRPERSAAERGQRVTNSEGGPPQFRVFLRIDDDEYSFDPDGTASLPNFPAAALSIIVR